MLITIGSVVWIPTLIVPLWLTIRTELRYLLLLLFGKYFQHILIQLFNKECFLDTSVPFNKFVPHFGPLGFVR